MNSTNFPKFPRSLKFILGIFICLLLLPQTRFVLTEHLRMEFLQGNEAKSNELRKVVDANPNDYKLQLAKVINLTGSKDAGGSTNPSEISAQPTSPEQTALVNEDALSTKQMKGLIALTDQFPNEIGLKAITLRFMCFSVAMLKRDNETVFGDKTSKQTPPTPLTTRQIAYLAIYDKIATDGEVADPQNAYFPMMRAIGQYVCRQDAEAEASIHRAAKASFWNEYVTDEVGAGDYLERKAFSETKQTSRMTRFASVMFPHYSQLRAAVRLTTHRAIQMERAGNHQQAIALRRAVGEVGVKMADDSTVLISTFVGIAITAIATSEYQTEEQKLKNKAYSTEDQHQLRLQRFTNRLKDQGYSEDANWFNLQLTRLAGQKKVIQSSLQDHPLDPIAFIKNFGLWSLGWVALSNAGILVLAGLLAQTAFRLRLKSRLGWSIAIFSIFGILLLQYYAALMWVNPVVRLNIHVADSNDIEMQSRFLTALLAGLSVIVPVILIGVLAIASSSCRVPLMTGLTRGMRRLALPLALACTLVYAGISFSTVLHEKMLKVQMNRIVANERDALTQPLKITFEDLL